MRFITYRAIAGVTATADTYSAVFDISSVFSMGVQAHIFSGTAKGKAYIEVSCDSLDEKPTNWVALPDTADLSSTATKAFVRTDICANWCRIFWAHSSGTGTLDVHVKTNGY